MKAFILAAGLGKRLRPITDELPKALIDINGRPMIAFLIDKLRESGITEIIVNVHYKAALLIDFLKKYDAGIPLHISDETTKLLDTGGAVKKAAGFFQDDFLVHNADVLSNIDLNNLINDHQRRNAFATLAVRKRNSSRYLLFDSHMRLSGWENINSGEKKIPGGSGKELESFAFSGIHVLNPGITGYMPEEDVFSIIDVYLRACSRESIFGYLHNDDSWLDMGRPDDLEKARNLPEGPNKNNR